MGGLAHFSIGSKCRFFSAGTQLPSSLLICLWLSLFSAGEVSAGHYAEFGLNIMSMDNTFSLQKNGLCCDGSHPMWSVSPPCSAPCNTVLLFCVGNYDARSYATWYPVTNDDEQQCTYAYGQLGPFGTSKISSANISINISSILNAFTFQIVARNMINNSISKSNLIAVYHVNDNAVSNSVWKTVILSDNPSVNTVVPVSTAISINYGTQCQPNYYGSTCNTYCLARDDMFGHYRCLPNGGKQCLPGWNGTMCTVPICPLGCAQGSCTQPYKCKCHAGWTGVNCSECVLYPGCSPDRAFCNSAYECICKPGWGGNLCNTDVSYCLNSPCQNGGTCRINYTAVGMSNSNSSVGTSYSWYSCECAAGYVGTTCETRLSSWTKNCSAEQAQAAQCLNGASCQVNVSRSSGAQIGNSTTTTVTCACTSGYYGPTCANALPKCTSGYCLNGGSCSTVNSTIVCSCTAEYSGSRCQHSASAIQSSTTAGGACAMMPCSSYQVCIDLGGANFQCRCPAEYEGVQCDKISSAAGSDYGTGSIFSSNSTSLEILIIVAVIIFLLIAIALVVVMSFIRRQRLRHKQKHKHSKEAKKVEDVDVDDEIDNCEPSKPDGENFDDIDKVKRPNGSQLSQVQVVINNLDACSCTTRSDCARNNQMNENIANQKLVLQCTDCVSSSGCYSWMHSGANASNSNNNNNRRKAATNPNASIDSSSIGMNTKHEMRCGKIGMGNMNFEMPQQKAIVKCIDMPVDSSSSSSSKSKRVYRKSDDSIAQQVNQGDRDSFDLDTPPQCQPRSHGTAGSNNTSSAVSQRCLKTLRHYTDRDRDYEYDYDRSSSLSATSVNTTSLNLSPRSARPHAYDYKRGYRHAMNDYVVFPAVDTSILFREYDSIADDDNSLPTPVIHKSVRSNANGCDSPTLTNKSASLSHSHVSNTQALQNHREEARSRGRDRIWNQRESMIPANHCSVTSDPVNIYSDKPTATAAAAAAQTAVFTQSSVV